ncbi:MAG: metallophosphoesterase [Bacteroidales bacterium]|nr:metallophosphoesterase [Bacteroidales bacterium]
MKFILLLVLFAHVYVSWRAFKIVPFPTLGKWLVVVLMLLALLALVLRFVRQFQGAFSLGFDSALYVVGTSWLIALLYLFFAFAILDISVLLRWVPRSFNHDSTWGAAAVFGVVALLMALGSVRYQSKDRVELNLSTSKPLPKPLKLVMLSDVHLGFHIGKAEFSQWVDLINAEQPDVVLIAGDIIDISMAPVNAQRLHEEFRRIKAPVYACYGNHEYFSNIDEVNKFYEQAGIHLLRDSAATVHGVNIIGRDDRTNGHRATLHSLMQKVDASRFTIVLDHQPFHLEQAERERVDFQFSGHTHQGQVFPMSLVTRAMYETDHGFLRKGGTSVYVSSGIGIWGGKFRIGTTSEYVVATITPQGVE